MKRILAVILVLVMAFALIGCGAGAQEAQDIQDVTPIKVGFIYLHDENSTYDANFLNAAKQACEAMGAECINKTNIPESGACYDAAAELVDIGCDIVFADSFGHESYMMQAAQDFPEVEFCHATGTCAHTAGLPNFHNAFAAIYEGRYLAGIAAGLKLNEMIDAGMPAEEAVIGYVAAYPYAEVMSGYTSFFLGARSMCPSATMKVVYTNSWYDESLEKEGATALISSGCVLISQHADSMGAPSACEAAGVPNISYNGSTEKACPNTFIVSSRIDWAPYFEYIITCVRDGQSIDADWTGTMANGAVALTSVNESVAAIGTVDKIKEVKQQLEDGSIAVFDTSTWTYKGEHLTEYLADVDTDAAYTPDTNVIFDGYFHESEFRSAPYFDLLIDGISLLNS